MLWRNYSAGKVEGDKKLLRNGNLSPLRYCVHELLYITFAAGRLLRLPSPATQHILLLPFSFVFWILPLDSVYSLSGQILCSASRHSVAVSSHPSYFLWPPLSTLHQAGPGNCGCSHCMSPSCVHYLPPWTACRFPHRFVEFNSCFQKSWEAEQNIFV